MIAVPWQAYSMVHVVWHDYYHNPDVVRGTPFTSLSSPQMRGYPLFYEVYGKAMAHTYGTFMARLWHV